jgi:hypothetical protein
MRRVQRHVTIDEAAALLCSRADLLDREYTDRGIARALTEGRIRRIRRGWYVSEDAWADLWPESRHLLHVLAVARDARESTVVFAGASAAVVHGLPLYRYAPPRVEAVCETPRRHSTRDVIRHERALDPRDIVDVCRLRVTSLERTVADLAAALPLEAALSVADAGLRAVAVVKQVQDEGLAERWRRDMESRLASLRGARGVRQARRVIAFADGRAQLPGESVSRLQLHRLGVRVTDLQVRISAPNGGAYFPDFELGDVNAFGEYDGEGKYTDEAMRSGRTLEQVLLAEKRREDWIRGTTGRRVVRWGDREAASAAALGRRLAAFGIPVRG